MVRPIGLCECEFVMFAIDIVHHRACICHASTAAEGRRSCARHPSETSAETSCNLKKDNRTNNYPSHDYRRRTADFYRSANACIGKVSDPRTDKMFTRVWPDIIRGLAADEYCNAFWTQGNGAGLQLSDDVGGDVVVKARPVGADAA